MFGDEGIKLSIVAAVATGGQSLQFFMWLMEVYKVVCRVMEVTNSSVVSGLPTLIKNGGVQSKGSCSGPALFAVTAKKSSNIQGSSLSQSYLVW